jgi:alkyl hydroperoxide reductase subunit D
MTTIDQIRDRIPEFAKDLSLNLSTALTTRGSPELAERQIFATALACAVAVGNDELTTAIERAGAECLEDADVRAARAAAAIMGMNNVYYRFVHFAGQSEYGKLPARLRMNVIGNPGVAKEDFELYSLAVSAINGCELCVKSHEATLRKHGMSVQAIQSAARIAAVIHAVAGVLGEDAATAARAA